MMKAKRKRSFDFSLTRREVEEINSNFSFTCSGISFPICFSCVRNKSCDEQRKLKWSQLWRTNDFYDGKEVGRRRRKNAFKAPFPFLCPTSCGLFTTKIVKRIFFHFSAFVIHGPFSQIAIIFFFHPCSITSIQGVPTDAPTLDSVIYRPYFLAESRIE